MTTEQTLDKIAIEDLLSGLSDPLVKRALTGIFQIRRNLGDSLIDAKIYALRCFVDPKHPSLNEH